MLDQLTNAPLLSILAVILIWKLRGAFVRRADGKREWFVGLGHADPAAGLSKWLARVIGRRDDHSEDPPD